MKCIIADDEYKSIELLRGYIQEVDDLQLEATFRNPVEALTYLEKNDIDLVFLDINMPRLTGIDLVKALQKKPLIIFTTAYSQHALEGFELDVVDYLLKPITFDRFLKAISKARNARNKNTAPSIVENDSPFILVHSGSQIHQLRKDEVLFIEKDRNYATIHTATRKIVTRQSFEELQHQFNWKNFVRIHKSFIVSIPHISLIESHQVVIQGHKIPIGASFRESFMKQLGSF